MIRDFSEEKKEELYKALEVIDIKEWKPFMTWCGGRAGEFGVWADRLGILSYTRWIDDYQNRILDTNNSTRNQIDTIFENVAEVDRRYVEVFRGYVEIVREQMLHIQTMTQVMCAVNRSKKDGDNGIPLKDAVDILSAEVSIEEFEKKLQCYGKGNDVSYENLCEYLDLLLSRHYLTRSEYVAMKGYISNLGHVPSSEENTIRENISKLLSNLASIDEKIEVAKRNMSLDNPRAIVEYRLLNEYRNDLLDSTMTLDEIEKVIDVLQERNPQMLKNIGVLYWYDPSECDNQMNKVIEIAAAYLLKPTGKEIGLIQLYDVPTVGSDGRIVNIPVDADRSSWASFEPLADINSWAKKVIGNSNAVDNEGGILTDKDGRYWIAVGPNVMNPNHGDKEIELEEMNYGTKIDVVVCDVDGNKYYIPCVVGDCKQHTHPTGIIQTGKNFPNGGDYHPENDDGSIIEFFTTETRYSEYKLVDVIVYDNE